MNNILTIVPIVVFLAAGFAAPVVYRWYRRGLTPLVLASSGMCLVTTLWVALQVAREGPQRYFMGGWEAPWGIEIWVDSWAALGGVTLTVVALPVLVYALKDSYTQLQESVVGRYLALIMILLASMYGVIVTADLFNLFVLVELTSLAACGIIAVKGDKLATEASFRYLILGALGSGAILMAVALLYMVTGHLNMAMAGEEITIAVLNYPRVVYAALGFLLLGMGIKAALFPLHLWLPDAHSSGPTTASALLSGLVVKVFIFSLWRVFDLVFGMGLLEAVPVRQLLLALGTVGTLAGSIFALGQRDIKRVLAYSTVANIGYIFLGLGLGTPRALVGAALHIINHAIMKSGLFLTAGAMAHAAGTRDVQGFAGLGQRLPLTLSAFGVGALGMVGIPPFSGFVSKWYLTLGALDGGEPFYVLVILVASLLSGLYYFPILISAFFGGWPSGKPAQEPHPMLLGPILMLALATVILGLFPGPLLSLLGR